MFLWNELQTASRPILIYGMGNGAEKVLELCQKYGIRPAGLFASDSHARTGVFQGFPVMARSEALQKYPNALILLAFGTGGDHGASRPVPGRPAPDPRCASFGGRKPDPGQCGHTGG